MIKQFWFLLFNFDKKLHVVLNFLWCCFFQHVISLRGETKPYLLQICPMGISSMKRYIHMICVAYITNTTTLRQLVRLLFEYL